MNKYNKIADINSEEKFSVSIVLPLYNEYQSLVTLFEEIEKFYYKKKIEVEFIIVNDGSNDGSLLLLQKLANERKNLKTQSKNNGLKSRKKKKKKSIKK